MTTTANPARLQVRDLLTAAHPTWNVIATARTPDAIGKPTAIIWTDKLDRGYAGGLELVTSTVELWLLTYKQDQPEDHLDAMLTDVLDTLEDPDWLTWTEATRSALDGIWHGWHITLTVAHNLTKE